MMRYWSNEYEDQILFAPTVALLCISALTNTVACVPSQSVINAVVPLPAMLPNFCTFKM